MKSIRVILVEDHHLVRQSLRSRLELERDITVIGEAGDGLEAVGLAAQLQPDVLIVDLMVPRLGGLEILHQVRARCPHTRCLVLSMYDDGVYVRAALKNGASGYVLKDEDATALIHAIHLVMEGQRYLAPRIADYAVELPSQTSKAHPINPYETLTPREREILDLVTEGLSSIQIAERLFISPRTVEHHRTHLMRKLSVRSSAELIRYALRREIVG